jgi:predicted DNA-binding transcriptional regulator YafY
MKGNIKTDRILEIFYRAMKGEALSANSLADEYKVSTRSISRDLTGLKMFLADHRDAMGNAELVYTSSDHCYRLHMDNFITNKELLAVTKILIGVKAFASDDLLHLIGKLKEHTSAGDKKTLEKLIQKELLHYSNIKLDCHSLLDTIWLVSECIDIRQPITITYYRMDHKEVKHRLLPIAILFTEYYFYLLAYKDGAKKAVPYYFRIDRITKITRHRTTFTLTRDQNFDEGLLRRRSQFMWPGKLRNIRFEFSGPSVQAILDRLPTAKIIDVKNKTYTLEAEVYGDGIKIYLLSQGSWVKVLAPQEFADEIKAEIEKMRKYYT